MIAIETKDYYSVLKECWEGDKDGWSVYHESAPSCLEKCILDTVLVLTNDTTVKFKFFKLEENGETVGFFGYDKDRGFKILTTFGVKVNRRKSDTTSRIWSYICNRIRGKFIVALYKKNTRCIKFLLSKGLEQIEVNSEDKVLFIKHKDTICQ